MKLASKRVIQQLRRMFPKERPWLYAAAFNMWVNKNGVVVRMHVETSSGAPLGYVTNYRRSDNGDVVPMRS